MNLGKEINSILIREGNVKRVLDVGFTENWLDDLNGGSEAIFDGIDLNAYKFILNHYMRHRKVPEEDVFLLNFPTYTFSKKNNTIEEILELSVNSVRNNLINRYLSDALDLQDAERYDEVSTLFESAARKLTKDFNDTPDVAIHLGDSEFDIESYLDEVKEEGVPMGIETIDKDFWGWQPGQLITFLGRQKAGKTTLLVNSALEAWKKGFSVLVFSVELNEDEIRQKVYSIGAHVSPTRLRRRQLHTSERRKVIEFDKSLKTDADDVYFLISHKVNLMTINDIKEEIELYSPHAVYIDGTYFIMDEETKATPSMDWRADNNVSAQLKLLATRYNIPVIVTTQSQEKQQGSSKKAGIEAKTIQGGTGLLKFSDLVLGIDKANESGVQMINEVHSRFDPVSDVMVHWDFNDMTLEEVEAEAFELDDEVAI